MRHIVGIGIGILALAVILWQSGVVNALLLFLIMGAVPSSNLTLSPLVMLAICVVGIWLAFFGISQMITSYYPHNHRLSSRKSPPPVLPRRRYSRSKS